MRICPELKITAIADRLTDANLMSCFSDCSVIVEGLDKAEEKKMLLEEFAGDHRIVVSASGIAGSSVDSISIRNYGNGSIVGDFVRWVSCYFVVQGLNDFSLWFVVLRNRWS